MPLPALSIAHYLLTLTEPEVGETLSHVKLQKLLYYAQGFYLALHNEPLFEEEMVNWLNGPVVKEVFNTYEANGKALGQLPMPEGVDFLQFGEEQKSILNQVYEYYGQFSAWKLRDMTHQERPWRETARNEVIPKMLLKEFFLTQLVDVEG